MKSAFLIMAHGNFDMLKLLISALDYVDNDIYIHIDKKCGKIDYKQFETLAKVSNVFCLKDRLKVTWGSYSQIKLELKMFDAAYNNSGGVKYDYFHILSGVDFPLKRNIDISNFLEKNKGAEFVGMVDAHGTIKYRLGYYHLYTDRNIFGKLYRHLFIPMQKVLHIHNKKDLSNYRLGANWCSISATLVCAILNEKKKIIKRYRFGFCCDEVFLQTFVFEHKCFLKRIYCHNDQYKSCMRYVDFKRGAPYTFDVTDMKELYKADRLFVRKITMPAMLKLKEHLSDKKMSVLLSIIIPIYNVEQYIEKCLKSIYGQIDGLSVEVILVNDGTPDKSMEIARQFINDRAQVINQKNQGLSVARNNGLKAAHGKYVWFVDSDDWIADGTICKLCGCIEKYNSEVFVVGIKAFDENDKPIVSYHPITPNNDFTTKSGAAWILTPHFERGPMQIFIMERAFLLENDLNFVKGLLHEDLEFAPRMLVKAATVTYIPQDVYCYLIRTNGSITSTVNPKRFSDLFFILKEHEQFRQSLGIPLHRKAMDASQWMLLRTLIAYLKRYNYTGMNLCEIPFSKMIRRVAFHSSVICPKLTYKIKFFLTGIYPNIYKYIKW